MSTVKEQATCYVIRPEGGFGWARAYVQTKGHWCSLSINSDYGVYAFIWTSMGQPAHEFLASLSFDYAMNKLTSNKHTIFDLEESAIRLKRWVLQARRQNNNTTEEARELFDEAQSCSTDDLSEEAFHHKISTHKAYYEYELYLELSARKRCPSAQGFWDEFWPEIVKAIAADAVVSAAA